MSKQDPKRVTTVIRGVVGNKDRFVVKTTRTAPVSLESVPASPRPAIEAALHARHAGDVSPIVWNPRIPHREGWIVEREDGQLIIAHYRSETVSIADLEAQTSAAVALDWLHDREVQLAEIGHAFLDASARAGELQAALGDANLRAQRLAAHARDLDEKLDAALRELRALRRKPTR